MASGVGGMADTKTMIEQTYSAFSKRDRVSQTSADMAASFHVGRSVPYRTLADWDDTASGGPKRHGR